MTGAGALQQNRAGGCTLAPHITGLRSRPVPSPPRAHFLTFAAGTCLPQSTAGRSEIMQPE